MTDPIQELGAAIKTDITKVEAFVHKEWDVFLNDITYLKNEAITLKTALANADPGIQATFQQLLTTGEEAFARLATSGNSGLSQALASGIDSTEIAALNFLGKAGVGSGVSPIVASALGEAGALLKDVVTVGFTRAVAGIARTAGVASPLPATGP